MSFLIWKTICDFIDENYTMDAVWDGGGKYGHYVLRFTKSKKTLCTLYVREKHFGCWVIYGKAEREKYESIKTDISEKARKIYDDAAVYHDGKWIMFDVFDDSIVNDIEKLIAVKKKPNHGKS